MQTITQTFSESLQELWADILGIIPELISAVAVFILGWLVAVLLGKAVTKLAQALQIDKLFNQLGVMKHIRKAGLEWEVSSLLGGLVKWFLIVVSFLAAVDILQLDQLSSFITEVLLYLPNVVIAVLILLVAAVLVRFLDRVVKASLEGTRDVVPAKFLRAVTRLSVWGFAILAALNQLGIANSLVEILFMGLVGMLALAGGLAFGLGGQDAAKRVLEKVKSEVTEE